MCSTIADHEDIGRRPYLLSVAGATLGNDNGVIRVRRPGKADNMAGEYFEIRKSDQNRQYWWRLIDSNHRQIGTSGETYVNKQHAINMADQVRSLASTTPIYDKTGE
jgi:uncharacterized protein YegP (UPF0339 family)